MLPIAVERGQGRPIYRQIEDQLRDAIRDGRLPAGTRLPSVRDLADQLGVARITVTNAYDDLVAEGLLTARVGHGTRVVPVRSDQPAPRGDVWRAPSDASQPTVVDLRPGPVGMHLFPRDQWAQHVSRAARAVTDRSSGAPPDPLGERELRQAIARRVGIRSGVRATADSIMIFSSVSTACATLARAVADVSSRCVAEDPGCPFFTQALGVRNSVVLGAVVDDRGLVPEQLPHDADLLLVGPGWQYPAGGTMPMDRRRAVLDWAYRTHALVLEHEWAGSVRFSGGPLPAIQSMDSRSVVAFAGGFTEVVPMFGLGYLVVPEPLFQRVTAARSPFEPPPPATEQRAFAAFLESGAFDAYLRRLRTELEGHRAVTEDNVGRWFGGRAELRMSAAGTVARLALCDGTRASAVARDARTDHVRVAPLSEFWLGSGPDDELLIDYGGVTPDLLSAGIERLADAHSRVSR